MIDALVTQLTPRLADPDKAVHLPGHFLEAAVAYYATTGKRKMLDAALEDADVIGAEAKFRELEAEQMQEMHNSRNDAYRNNLDGGARDHRRPQAFSSGIILNEGGIHGQRCL